MTKEYFKCECGEYKEKKDLKAIYWKIDGMQVYYYAYCSKCISIINAKDKAKKEELWFLK